LKIKERIRIATTKTLTEYKLSLRLSSAAKVQSKLNRQKNMTVEILLPRPVYFPRHKNNWEKL
jgi:hypothetical protein